MEELKQQRSAKKLKRYILEGDAFVEQDSKPGSK